MVPVDVLLRHFMVECILGDVEDHFLQRVFTKEFRIIMTIRM
jgi:hypothetical protein